MELNNQADAIILSKVSDRKNIVAIKSNDIYLGCITALGLASKQLSLNKSPISYLSPFYLKLTILSRKANTNISAILGSEGYKKELPYSDSKTAILFLTQALSDLGICAAKFEDIGSKKQILTKELKDEVRLVQGDAITATYIVLKNLELILGKNKSNISELQANTLKHLDQLIKLI